MPRQFGAGERVVFTGAIIPKTRALFLKRSTKATAAMARVLRCVA